jgi:hypothetical protein
MAAVLPWKRTLSNPYINLIRGKFQGWWDDTAKGGGAAFPGEQAIGCPRAVHRGEDKMRFNREDAKNAKEFTNRRIGD